MKNPVNIMVLTYWPYDDALIQTYTLPYVKIISKNLPPNSKILLVTLDTTDITPDKELEKFNIQQISIRYKPFGGGAMFLWLQKIFFLKHLIKKENINTIHAWCTPAGMIGYILSVMTKTKLVIDSFEPHAEAMVENKTWSKSGFNYRLLIYFEKLQAKRASDLIFAAPGMENYIKEKYHYSPKNYFVKPACVDLEKFKPAGKDKGLLEKLDLTDKIICVYAGKFGGIYLEDEVFEFIKCCEEYWGDKFRFLLLSNSTDTYLSQKISRFNINNKTISKIFVPFAEVQRYMNLADFAICPVKPVPSKKYCSPIKNGEYWALGLPVIITQNISEDSEIIEKNNAGFVLKSFGKTEYISAITQIESLIADPSNKEKIRNLAVKYRSYGVAEKIYSVIYH